MSPLKENFIEQIKDDRNKSILICNVTLNKLIEYGLMMSRRYPDSIDEFKKATE